MNSQETLVDEGLELLNELNMLAPLAESSVSTLEDNGWKQFYTYNESYPDGTPVTEHLKLAIKKNQRRDTTNSKRMGIMQGTI